MLPLLKISISLQDLKLPFRKALEVAGRLGIDGVEIDARYDIRPKELSDTGVRQLKKTLSDFNLKVSAVRFQTRRGYQTLDDLDARIDATKAAMEMAYKLGTSTVINQIGMVPEDEESKTWKVMIEAISDLGRFGNRTGAWLTATTGTESGEDLNRLIHSLPEGSLRVNFDPGNLIINGFSPIEDLRELGPHVGYVSARDAVRDLARGRGLEVPMGRGSVDFPQMLAILEENEYTNYLSVARENAENPTEEISNAVSYLRALWE